MAIMGFGGGAFIASPLSVWLMSRFATPSHVGVSQTFLTMGITYFCFMMVGAIIVRIPAPGWKPEGYVPPAQPKKLITNQNVYVYDALKTPQFWLIWWVLCLNVTAGIGVCLGAGFGNEPGDVPRTRHAGGGGGLCRHPSRLGSHSNRYQRLSVVPLIGRHSEAPMARASESPYPSPLH